MAMKLPIIISVPEGESTEIVRKEKLGLVIAPENPYRLAEALLNIKKDNNMYNTYAKNCFLAAIKFNRKKLSIKMLNYIEVI